MTRIGTYYIEALFEITGRGPVFTGKMIEGIVQAGFYLEFTLKDQSYKRKITGVEFGRKAPPEQEDLIGLLLSTQTKEEIKVWKKLWEEGKAYIYSEKLTLSDTQLWYTKLGREDKILFHECLLECRAIMNRAIEADDQTPDLVKAAALTWSKQLAHRIGNIQFAQTGETITDPENELIERINFYTKQSPELAAHLAVWLSSSIDRYYTLKEKETP